jgi:hypothetical protein
VAIQYRSGTTAGSDAMLRSTSVRLNGTCALSQAEVPM